METPPGKRSAMEPENLESDAKPGPKKTSDPVESATKRTARRQRFSSS